MVKKISVFIMILGLFFVGIPRYNVKAESYSDKNLASPDLEGKEEINNGLYTLYNSNGIIIDYNVFNGIFRINGTWTNTTGSNVVISFSNNQYLNHLVGLTLVVSVEIVSGDLPFGVSYRPSGLLEYELNSFVGEAYYVPYIRNDDYLYMVNGAVFDNFQYRVQLEQDDVATPYIVPLQSFLWHDRQYINDSIYDDIWDNAFNAGYDYGLENMPGDLDTAYWDGYDYGFGHGKTYGERIGYQKGLEETDATGFVGLLTTIFVGLGALLGIEILPGIYIGAIIAVPLVFGIIFFILGKRKGD